MWPKSVTGRRFRYVVDAGHSSLTKGKAIASDTKPAADPPVETGLAALLDHLEIASAHFAGRGSADLRGFMSRCPERLASLTLLCPVVLDPRSRIRKVRSPASPIACAAPGRRWCCCRSIYHQGNGSR